MLKINNASPELARGELSAVMSRPFGPLMTLDAVAASDGLEAAVVVALIGSSRIRYGAMPTHENVESIRRVVASAMSRLAPIPMLMPWGSKKPDNGAPDVAELAALRTLESLEERVTRLYAPGVELRVRVEDASGDYLFAEEGPEAVAASALYVRDFYRLLDVVGLRFVRPFRESEVLDVPAYYLLVNELRPLFMSYMTETEDLGVVDDPSLASWRRLEARGWRGLIPKEQRDFYTSRYARAQPDATREELLWKLSGYFATILARINMRGYGSEDWGRDFINISFASPVPGTPRSMEERRLYYRTIPETMGRTHLPPWRAHGYVRLGDGGGLKLGSFADDLRLVDGSVELSGERGAVTLRAPLMLA